jgi:hypothetical protein
MRRSLATLLSLLLACLAAAPAAAQSAPTALRGDVNGDGRVTVLDALAVLAYVVGRPLPAGYRLQAADADGSGAVTTLDALVIAGFAAGRDVSRFPVGTPIQAAVRADAIDCAADATSGTLSCRAPQAELPAGVRAVVLGGQDVYVRLTSAHPHFDPDTRLFTADVRVTNLLAQTLGLQPDGTVNPDGIRVFFNEISSASIAVMNNDGSGTFLAPEQPFYQYAAPLAPGDSTLARQWTWHLPEGVNSFTFRVYASGQVQYPGDNTNQADLEHEREQGVRLLLVSGGGQTGAPGQPLPQPVVVRVLDVNGSPRPDAVVNFLVHDGGSAEPMQARTDTAGYARTTWTLGTATGTQEMRVSGTGGTLAVTANALTPPSVTSVTISPDSLVLAIGAMAAFTTTAHDAAGGTVPGTATWTSSDTAVARVDATGKVTAVAAGTVTVTATIAGVSATAQVRVKPPTPGRVVRVVVSPDSLVFIQNEVRSFTATAYDSAGLVVNAGYFRWATSDSNVVRLVDLNGRVLAISPGQVTISATVAGVTGTGVARVRFPATYPARVTWIQKRNVVCCELVDVSNGTQGVNYFIDVSRFVGTLSMTVRSPSGELIPCGNMDADDDSHRSFRCNLEIPATSTPGVWTVDRVTLDGTVLSGADLDSTWTRGRRFDVFGGGADASPPQVRSVVPENHGGVYSFKFGVVDHRSGVSSVSAVVRGPSGQHQTCTATSTNRPVEKSGDWLCRLTVPAGSGRWSLESVTATDAAGNTSTSTPAQIEPIRGAFEYTFLWFEFDA